MKFVKSADRCDGDTPAAAATPPAPPVRPPARRRRAACRASCRRVDWESGPGKSRPNAEVRGFPLAPVVVVVCGGFMCDISWRVLGLVGGGRGFLEVVSFYGKDGISGVYSAVVGFGRGIRVLCVLLACGFLVRLRRSKGFFEDFLGDLTICNSFE
ncbi:hypothetical protein ABZP36_028929 [Zizania latifolia]